MEEPAPPAVAELAAFFVFCCCCAAQILSYTGGQLLHYAEAGLAKRLKFTGDPKRGDATISIANVLVSDTGTYQCKVKKAPGVDMRKVTLVVMGEQKLLRLNPPPPPTSFSQPVILSLTCGFLF